MIKTNRSKGELFMYRVAEDFVKDWAIASKGALKVIQAIPDEKMDVAIVDGHNSLGWLSWHLVSVAGAFGQFAGFWRSQHQDQICHSQKQWRKSWRNTKRCAKP